MSDVRACLAAVQSFLSHLPLFFAAHPRTPLRVLGIVALDMLHVLRCGRRLPRTRTDALALFLDLEGCANAAWDHKAVCLEEWRAIRQRLDDAGLGPSVHDYLGRLQALESTRPSAGGDALRFAQVRTYRESVARLSITTAAGIALTQDDIGQTGDRRYTDGDVDTLYRILMQCQIIDDIFDYADDLSAGLPSFLTASTSPSESLASAAAAARSYGGSHGRSSNSVLPLRTTLWLFTTLTTFLIWIYGIRHSQRTHDWIWRWTVTSGR
ncbi:MAG TPA: hypothetical protein VM493_03485 [Vicinamibacterales bacterium]|nr:hypothetical protein [Vicinamibacterales bacterium]